MLFPERAGWDDRSVKRDDQSRGPGIAKVRKTQVVTRHTLELCAVREGWWSSVLEEADIVSEGDVVIEEGARVYYGTTSLRAAISDISHDPATLARIVITDPHARLRLLRLAHREAVVRAGAPIDVMHAEMAAEVLEAPTAEDQRGRVLAIAIDVSAAIPDLPTSRKSAL